MWKVLEQKKMIPLSLFAVCPGDITILVDHSGSIRDNNPTDGSYDNWEFVSCREKYMCIVTHEKRKPLI